MIDGKKIRCDKCGKVIGEITSITGQSVTSKYNSLHYRAYYRATLPDGCESDSTEFCSKACLAAEVNHFYDLVDRAEEVTFTVDFHFK